MANTKSGAPASHDIFFKLDGYEQHIQVTADTAEELFPKARVVIDWLKEIGATNKYDAPKYEPKTSDAGKGQSAMERAAQDSGFATKICQVDGSPLKFVSKRGKMRGDAYVCDQCGKWTNA